jgi:peptidoglycan/LPS O-acetylase OafA/YrhL
MLVANVTWSLTYEWLFYIALPLPAFVLSRARSPAAVCASVLALLLLGWGFGWQVPFRDSILQMFLGGIACVYWVRSETLVRWSRSNIGGLAALAALVLVVTCVPTAYASRAAIGLTIFFAVIASGNDLWGVLRWPGLLWLGDITYSIYLLHGLLLWLVFQNIVPPTLATDAGYSWRRPLPWRWRSSAPAAHRFSPWSARELRPAGAIIPCSGR